MREVNFSIPNANKASVGITTALYDRRALDCTSTLPLINSLNHLAYLTTSSNRIRDILTVDGGIERLVCILKEGRSTDVMEMWKWNLAFQCIVNIGVRGSEEVRRRVVEADMVPVIATVLDNWFQVVDKTRERVDEESRRNRSAGGAKGVPRSAARPDVHDPRSHESPSYESRSARGRREALPPLAIPETPSRPQADLAPEDVTPTAPAANLSLSSPPGRTTYSSPALGRHVPDTPRPVVPFPINTEPAQAFAPVRDMERVPPMLPTAHAEPSSRPQSPTTPAAPTSRPMSPRVAASELRLRRRPPIRHQLSVSGSDDDGVLDDAPLDEAVGEDGQPEIVVGIQADVVMQDAVDEEDLLDNDSAPLPVPDVSSAADVEAFDMTHHSSDDGSLVNPTDTPTQGQLPFPQTQMQPPVTLGVDAPSLPQFHTWHPARALADRLGPTGVLASMPREEDVLMSLQLLAYVSKYCYLRSYFQRSHLVPRLKIGHDLRLMTGDEGDDPPTQEELEDEWDSEFVVKPGEQPFNIFPLIEKFTVKPSSSSRHAQLQTSLHQGDMQYWAGVVMRNLCRKDESRGGIRQCAYWQCGKWEEYTRQFAKCRRCRRTKYCSKDCQKGAWGTHRFWCVAADTGDADPAAASAAPGPATAAGPAAAPADRLHHRHAHRPHHHHHHHHGAHGHGHGHGHGHHHH